MANPNYFEDPSYTRRVLKISKTVDSKTNAEELEQGEHFSTSGGSATCTATMKVSMAVSQKVGNSSTSNPDIPLFVMHPKYAV